jgi:probable HAF family extracellular repeat protein
MQNLGSLGGPDSVAYDISDDGTVVGEADAAELVSTAFVWKAAGGMRPIADGPQGAVAYGVNSTGAATGAALPDSDVWSGVFRVGAGGSDLSIVTKLGVGAASGTAISDAGLIVGQASRPPTATGDPDTVPGFGFVYDTASDDAYTFESPGEWSGYNDVNDKVVVGSARRADDLGGIAFVQPLTGTRTTLPLPGAAATTVSVSASEPATRGASDVVPQPVLETVNKPATTPTVDVPSTTTVDLTLAASTRPVQHQEPLAGGVVVLALVALASGATARHCRGRARQKAERPYLAKVIAAASVIGLFASLTPIAPGLGAATCNCNALEAQVSSAQSSLDASKKELAAAEATSFS